MLVLFLQDVALSNDLFNEEYLELLDHVARHRAQPRHVAHQEVYFLLAYRELRFLYYLLVEALVDEDHPAFLCDDLGIIVSGVSR